METDGRTGELQCCMRMPSRTSRAISQGLSSVSPGVSTEIKATNRCNERRHLSCNKRFERRDIARTGVQEFGASVKNNEAEGWGCIGFGSVCLGVKLRAASRQTLLRIRIRRSGTWVHGGPRTEAILRGTSLPETDVCGNQDPRKPAGLATFWGTGHFV